MIDANMKLSDDMLEGISGGVDRTGYNDNQLRQAGVIITDQNGKKTYSVKTSNGTMTNISRNVAYDVCDCYKVAGNTRLSGADLDALIAQSQ